MNTNIELKKANGEIIKVELISYFEHIPTSKKYIFYTLNEKVENELSKLIINRTYEMYNKEKDEYKTDILNIASLLYRKKSELSSNEDYLNLINLNVDAKVQILNQGGIRKQW